MNRLIALCVVIATATAYADPASVKVKTALIEVPNGEEFVVNGGIWVNDEGVVVINTTLDDLNAQVKSLVGQLKSANAKIADCSGTIPGFPTWATILISSVLSAITATVGYFAITQVK